MTEVINSTGWAEWSTSDPNTEGVYFVSNAPGVLGDGRSPSFRDSLCSNAWQSKLHSRVRSNTSQGEYNNTGAGASGPRASFATKLCSAVSIDTILGSNYTSAGYYDASYL